MSHVYYVSCWYPTKTQFQQFKQLLRTYLWSNDCGEQGLPLFPGDASTMCKDKGGLGLIDIASQSSVLAAKWVVWCLEGSSPLASSISALAEVSTAYWQSEGDF